MPKPIYVEIPIRATLDTVWDHTQNPRLHERWDLRFTDIDYLPRVDASEPQTFRYATRIGFGMALEGSGESTGGRESDGTRTSALRFWSDDLRSLIREGSGYWKYVPGDDTIRFLTLYDYRVRFGALGRLFDRFVFRPLMGWATAWSFDRLRLWLERGLEPGVALRLGWIHLLSRLGVAIVWLYHGLVPKLVFRHEDETILLLESGVDPQLADTLVVVAGGLEVALGLAVISFWHARSLLWLTLAAMVLATIGVSIRCPRFLVAAFNPVTLNLQLAILAIVALVSGRNVPSARSCRRRKPE